VFNQEKVIIKKAVGSNQGYNQEAQGYNQEGYNQEGQGSNQGSNQEGSNQKGYKYESDGPSKDQIEADATIA